MRRFLAVLLTLTMVAQVMMLPVAVAEEVATPSDIRLVCEACNSDPENIKLMWVADSNGSHVIKCAHHTPLEETRHQERLGEITEYDNDHHYYSCNYPECEVKTSQWHSENCSERGVCADCGATNVKFAITDHDVDWKAYQFDDVNHWNVCKVCGEKTAVDAHSESCKTPGVCVGCGQANVTFSKVWHNSDWTKREYNNEECWEVCEDCGMILDISKHCDRCSNPGVCEYCGQYGVLFSETYHTCDRQKRLHNNEECWVVCEECGARDDIYTHEESCSNPGICIYCGAEDVGMVFAKTNHDEYVWKHDNTQCWRECPTCGDQTIKFNHSADCDNPNVCRNCGASGSDIVIAYTSHDIDYKVFDGYDKIEHWNTCKKCGAQEKSLHYQLCTNPGVCGGCGQKGDLNGETGVQLDGIIHNEGDWEYNSKEHWQICKDCGEKLWYFGHVNTCTNPNQCEICGQTNVEFEQIDHTWPSDGAYETDDKTHWMTCKDCGARFNDGVHYDDCKNPGVCINCEQSGVTMDHTNHQYDFNVYKFDNANHWNECKACGEKKYVGFHIGDCSNPGVCKTCGQSGVTLGETRHHYDSKQYDYDQYSHWFTCTVCGLQEYKNLHESYCTSPDECYICGQKDVIIDYVSHIGSPSGSTTWEHDNKAHWITCVCGEEYAREEHYNLCTDLTTCVECGATGVEFASTIHDWNTTEIEFNNEMCWRVCRNCNEKFDESYHANLCTEPNVCFYCHQGGVIVSELWHKCQPDAYEFDSKKHWQTCTVCGELVVEEHKALDDLTKCGMCGYPMSVETPLPTLAPATEKPTQAPTATPIPLPTEQVTAQPTAKPTEKPTEQATTKPTEKPTEQATAKPTEKPTEQATAKPSEKPTEQVTIEPTAKPAEQPTAKPTQEPAPVPTEAPAHEHTFDIAFVSNHDGTHSKACLSGCGEVLTEPCQLVTTDMGLMTCTACATCGYAVYTAKEGVAALSQGENVPAKVVRVETAAIAPAAESEPEAVPADTALLVHETTFEVPVALSTELKGTVEKVFTATLVKDGETIQPTGKVKLTIPMEEEALTALEGKVLMLLREDGTLVEIAYEIVDGQLVFLTDELGVFLLMDPAEEV